MQEYFLPNSFIYFSPSLTFLRPVKQRRLQFAPLNFRLILLLPALVGLVRAGYNVGVGRADITGPAAEVR